MLANTLCHIPCVSAAKERVLLKRGVHSWAGYLAIAKGQKLIDECEHQAKAKNPMSFADSLELA